MDQKNINRVHLDNTKKYRVVQWATGNIGTRSLRAVIEHPNMTLVGVHVHSEEKAGRDAGDLCGIDPVGVQATTSINDVIALKPDCVLHMPQGTDFEELCKLLASGINVVTTRGDFHNPAFLDPVLRNRVEEACHQGGTSIHSTGSSPGFITEAVPVVILSLSRRLDCLTIDEFADLSSRDSAFMLFEVMGFGKSSAEIPEHIMSHVGANFGPSISLIAEAISIPVDKYETTGEVATASKTTEITAGVIEAGTMAAQRITISAIRDGRPILRMRVNWFCTTDIEPAWKLRGSGWHILLEGGTPMELDISFPVSQEEYAAFTPGLTAHRAVNAVPFVCNATPGIRTTIDLPQIIANLG